MRHSAAGFLHKMRLQRTPSVVVFDLAAPRADMENALQISYTFRDLRFSQDYQEALAMVVQAGSKTRPE
jgi:hypothetical protein